MSDIMSKSISWSLARADIVVETTPMVNVLAVLARVSVSKFEGENAGRVVANVAKSSFPRLANFTFVEMSLQDGEILLNLVCLVAVVNVIQVLDAE
jgi:hypothetical protein